MIVVIENKHRDLIKNKKQQKLDETLNFERTFQFIQKILNYLVETHS